MHQRRVVSNDPPGVGGNLDGADSVRYERFMVTVFSSV